MNFSHVYALSALSWSIGGFMLGYATSSLVTILRLRRANSKNIVDVEDEKRVLNRLVSVFLISLALLSVIVGWRAAEKTQDTAERQQKAAERAEAIATCQSQFNADIKEISDQKDALTEAGRRDLTTMWAIVTKAIVSQDPKDGAAAQKAIIDYNKSLQERAKQREELDKKLPDINNLDCAHPQTGKAGK